MACVAEALGMMLPGSADLPASDSRRLAMAEKSGARIVEMVREDLRPSRIMTLQAIENAIRVDMAIGGSTNAIVHLIAIAGRLGIDLPLEKFDELSRTTPVVANVRPSGRYLMEDFSYAGGNAALMKEILPLLHGKALTVTGKTVAENLAQAACFNREVIKPLDEPLRPEGGTAILRGNLAPEGAVIKQSAISPHFARHRGRAVVFENNLDLINRVDDPKLDVDESSILVLKNAGPKGAPGMPEWGHLPIPAKLLKAGVRDMVRLSDARISGTSFGTMVVHISPESAVGGPLAVVKDGDLIELDVHGRRLELEVSNAELRKRLKSWKPPEPHYLRGYGRMFLDHILQAHQGCDFDFLLPVNGPEEVAPPVRFKNPAL
jgi:dihydroxy-acid dehydratase